MQANLISIKIGGNGAKDKTRYQILTPNRTPNRTPNQTPNQTPNRTPFLKKEVTQEKNNINKLNQTNKPPIVPPQGEQTKKNKNFVVPTVEEIKKYATTENLTIDPNHFFNFYQAKGWLIGKNKMKDWKAAARNWNRTEKQNTINQPFKQKSQQYEQF
ncbi:MAG: hypothetical protein EOL95_01355 [Bacteroidia bacterium]|nr:hypothetical protein [Bacteroidia bacterium]